MSEIRALLTDMPFGKRRIQIGLLLWDAMFVNGVLFNSKAWNNIIEKRMVGPNFFYRSLMGFIIGAHWKVQYGMLYLETSAITIPNKKNGLFSILITIEDCAHTKKFMKH